FVAYRGQTELLGPLRKIELYEMGWNLKDGLRECLVAAAPYGGPIALLKGHYRRSPSARPQLEIYSSSGLPLASFPWKSGVVKQLGWTVSDDLLCVQEDGTVLVYDLWGGFKRHFSMGNEVSQSQVLETKIFHSPYGTGVAILTGALRFTLATNIDDIKLRRLPEVPGLQEAPSCWAVLTQDRQSKVLVANGSQLFILDNTACTPVTPPGLSPQASSIVHMCVSFSYKYLALLTDSGHVWMGTSNLKEKLSEVDTKIKTPPKQMAWCRRPKSQQPSAVVMWDGLLIVVGECKETIQYHLDDDSVLVPELVYRKLYPLAIEVCRYLKTPEYQGVSRVLKHWACYKVQQKEESDEVIAKAVSVKLADAAGISYSEIATKAYESGRTELAIKLLEFEPRSGEQVPLLLKMKKSPLALSKAIESGDTDLVYTVVMYLKNELNRGDFFMMLRNQPVALSLYKQFCKHQEQDTLKDLFNQDDDHEELGNFYVKASYKDQRLEARVALLQSAVDEYYKAKNDFSAKTTEDEMRLLRFQRKLEEEKGEQLVGFSLHDTMTTLLSVGLHKHAEQLYKDFRVPDKRFWWLKLKALAEKEDWEELEKFGKTKKSPVGYLPFVEVCIKHHNKYEAKKYVSKVTPEQKVKAHLAVGDMEGAAEAAIERRNESEISTVLSRCSATTDHLLMERLNRAKATAVKK
uniref:Vacuolar protein sorting-associated protein 16 homolog n=1 Tax=Cyprinus carpio carpio TaxID=630221 RepID=A0A8C1HY65_CYPCA